MALYGTERLAGCDCRQAATILVCFHLKKNPKQTEKQTSKSSAMMPSRAASQPWFTYLCTACVCKPIAGRFAWDWGHHGCAGIWIILALRDATKSSLTFGPYHLNIICPWLKPFHLLQSHSNDFMSGLLIRNLFDEVLPFQLKSCKPHAPSQFILYIDNS